MEKSLDCDFFFAERQIIAVRKKKFIWKTGAKSIVFWYISPKPDRFFSDESNYLTCVV